MSTSDLRSPITLEEAAVIVGQQFPEWSDLPIEPVKQQGWDNTTFRLGSSLTARFPSANMYAPQVAKEGHVQTRGVTTTTTSIFGCSSN
jgi:aminoglycoside phosphotransferase (APT) family kinase protein